MGISLDSPLNFTAGLARATDYMKNWGGAHDGRIRAIESAEEELLVAQMAKLTQPPGFTGKQPGEVRTQFGHRMGGSQPLAPKLVAEVQYDHFTGRQVSPWRKVYSLTGGQEPAASVIAQIHSLEPVC